MLREKDRFRQRGRRLIEVIWAAMLVLMFTAGLEAAVVGQFTEVEGQVELLKGGKIPGVPVKPPDGVEVGDVVRTKTMARAQIKFIDDTTMTIAPGSRVAIEEYMYDASKNKRQAVVQVFQGLVKTAVGKVQQVEKPDFILKSHTAVMGVRGTTWYAQLTPTSTEVYTAESLLEVGNIFPEIPGKVLMKSRQYVMVGLGKAPTVPVDITHEDLKLMETRFSAKVGRDKGGLPPTPMGSVVATTSGGTGTGVLVDPAMTSATQSSFVQNVTSGLYVPPQVPVPVSIQPSPQTFSFTEVWNGNYQLTSPSPFTVGTYTGSGGVGTRTGVLSGPFTANFTFVATSSQPTFNSFITGTFSATNISGSVTGIPGGNLTGTMTMTGSTQGGTIFNLSGPVTLFANGSLTFTPTGTFNLSGISGPVTGTWTQVPTTPVLSAIIRATTVPPGSGLTDRIGGRGL